MALGHWHGYLWTGSSKDLKGESLRRPGASGTPQAQEFLRSSLPPMRLGHYLLRRNAVSANLTWTDVDDAIDWMAATYKSHPPMEGDVGFPPQTAPHLWLAMSDWTRADRPPATD